MVSIRGVGRPPIDAVQSPHSEKTISPIVDDCVKKAVQSIETHVSDEVQNIRIGSLLDKGDAHEDLQPIVKRLLQNELHEMGPRLIRQELQRNKAKEYDDTDASKAGILEWMRKNDDSPQDPPAQKPNRPKSFADDNPSNP